MNFLSDQFSNPKLKEEVLQNMQTTKPNVLEMSPDLKKIKLN